MGNYAANTTLWELLGAVDNFSEPKPMWNERSTIWGIVLTFTLTSIICIFFRLYARVFIAKCAGWDDVFVVLFMFTGALGTMMIVASVNVGLGQHFLSLTLSDMQKFMHFFYVASGCYVTSTAFIKLSLLFQYLRIFERGTFLRKLTICTACVIGVWGAIFSFMAWFPCFPPKIFWSMTPQNDKCYGFGSGYALAFTRTFESHAALNVIFDMIVLTIPIPMYFESGVTTQRRAGLIGLFVMGTIINVFSLWRLATVLQHRSTTYPTFDPTWYSPVSLIQACLEVDAASICASITVFWPVVHAKFNGIFVTNEVIITRSHRGHSILGGEDFGEDVELHRSESSFTHSADKSETTVTEISSKKSNVVAYDLSGRLSPQNDQYVTMKRERE